MSYPSSSRSEVYIGRDSNANYGSGAYTINYDNRIIQHRPRSTYRYIRGRTEEEEAEYEEYGEYRHSDIQIIGKIHSEQLKRYDPTTRRTVRIDCKRSIVLGVIVSGEGVGAMATVEAYEGSDAPEEWKQCFSHHTGQTFFGRVNNAHLFAINRSKVPMLIFSELVPFLEFWRSLGTFSELYLDALSVSGRSSKVDYYNHASYSGNGIVGQVSCGWILRVELSV
ncbi:hypothetical protein PM082_009274 [Marasmius tenuissimus]|nr:hypothetical protein PM082_009274 [Marasmius tenuissimus]